MEAPIEMILEKKMNSREADREKINLKKKKQQNQEQIIIDITKEMREDTMHISLKKQNQKNKVLVKYKIA